MTKEEAKQVLERNHYCTVHGTPKREHKQSSYGWPGETDYPYYTCDMCEVAREMGKARELKEALKTLGLPCPGQIIERG